MKPPPPIQPMTDIEFDEAYNATQVLLYATRTIQVMIRDGVPEFMKNLSYSELLNMLVAHFIESMEDFNKKQKTMIH